MTVPWQLQYGYDTAGRMSSLSDPGGVNLAFTYDGALPLSEMWSGGVVGSVSRTFTSNFEVATERVNGAHAVTFGYDADRLLTQAGAMTLARHPEHGLVTGTTLGSTTEAFEHNGIGEPIRQTARVGTTNVFDVQYTRDALGRITQRIEVIDGITRVWGYGYDVAGRLQSVRRNSTLISFYTYDANGNRTEANTEDGIVAATYDDQDRLLTYGNAIDTYTANGELATKTVGTQTTTYEYDTLGNLIEVVLPNGDEITYTIDGRGRRVAKELNGVRVKGWLYADQLRPIAELDGSGNVVSRFVYGSRLNVPEYVIKQGVTYRIFSDHIGSPRIVLNASTGEVVQRLDFTAFGEIIQDSNPGWQPLGFAGGLYDSDTDLVRFGARDYDAMSGRWTSKDPIRFEGGQNLYAYVNNSPIDFIDPSGLQEGSPANRAARQRVADIADSYIGTELWLKDVRKGTFGPGTYKCNLFVCDVTNEAGAPARVTTREGSRRCPLAGEYGNPNAPIPNWRTLGPNESAQPGDIIAYQYPFSDASGHSGVIGNEGPVSSHDYSPVRQSIPSQARREDCDSTLYGPVARSDL
jgi:RHS repeat-associated protein